MISKESRIHKDLSIPILNGLVLAGGMSKRMGQDKGRMRWHDQEQRYFMADLLDGICQEVFISCREDQLADIDDSYKTIKDHFSGLGPYGAILSAFKEHPDKAWLITACDLPLLDSATLLYLIGHRKTAAMATSLVSPYDGMPEPLMTIWEPKSYPVLLSFLAQGYSCPRKVLVQTDVTLIYGADPHVFINVNSPEEADRVKGILCQQNLSDL
jgi:molybdopterin-guanine dinucleotide biosynthesis protein A